MDKKTQLKLKEARGKLALAKINLDAANKMLESDIARVSTDVAYNAAELCARALILLKLDYIPSRHGSIVEKFGELYVKDGPLTKEVGRALNKGLDYRGDARYKPEATISKTHAPHNIKLTEKLIEFLEKQLNIL